LIWVPGYLSSRPRAGITGFPRKVGGDVIAVAADRILWHAERPTRGET
jgi:hypothetical protein